MVEMVITLSPVRGEGALSVAREGARALVNGAVFDFGQLAEGDRLPRAAVQCPALLTDVTKTGGVISFTLTAPHGQDAPETDRFPAPVTGETTGLTGPAGAIDWGQKMTASQQQSARLTAWRQTAVMTRTDFCLALVAAGILTPQEGVTAAKGDVPLSFEPIIMAQPDPPRTAMRIRWAAMTVVERENEFIAAVAQAAGIPASVLDGVFGWT